MQKFIQHEEENIDPNHIYNINKMRLIYKTIKFL